MADDPQRPDWLPYALIGGGATALLLLGAAVYKATKEPQTYEQARWDAMTPSERRGELLAALPVEYSDEYGSPAWGYQERGGVNALWPWSKRTQPTRQTQPEQITIEPAYGAYYSITPEGWEKTKRAKREGADARRAGIRYQDNPYRHGPVTPDDWLYSSWEYGWANPDTWMDERIVEED